jgi:hypothetical protein
MITRTLLILLLPAALLAQAPAKKDQQADLWRPVQFLVGDWEGSVTGEPGDGTVKRGYHFALRNKFLEVSNRSTYPAQPKNPQGEVHEDRGFISYDKQRRKFVLRQFHVEGFVNQYVLTSISPDRKTLVFETESIENIPAGWRARETYMIVNENQFIETFELAQPGKEFAMYSETRFKRKRPS